MKKTKYLFAILFMLVAFLAIGATSVNAETVTVSTFDELKEAFDGKKVDSAGNEVTDTSITGVKLGDDIIIPAEEDLHLKVINDITLDLNGYVIDANTNDKYIFIDYGSNGNGIKWFFDGSLIITDNSLSQSGTIKLKNKAITVSQYNLKDGNKNYKLTINGGKYYSDSGALTYLISIVDSDYYWKDKNITFDFKINKGYFKLADGKTYGEILLAQEMKSKNVEFSFSFDNLTFDAILGNLIRTSGDGNFTIDDGIPVDTDFYIYSKTGKEVLISDRTTVINGYLPDSYYKDETIFPDKRYAGIKLVKRQGFSINAPLFDSVDYGYDSIEPVSIAITNIGTSKTSIKNVTVSGTDFILGDGNKSELAGGEKDLSWKVKPKDGLEVGVHTATITVEDDKGGIYTADVSFEVKAIISTDPVTKEVTTLDEFKALMDNNHGVDIIKLGADILSTVDDDTGVSFVWNISGNKTLDLNGHIIKGVMERVFKLNYYGDYTVNIIDSSNSGTSNIIHEYNKAYGYIFVLYSSNYENTANKTLVIDGVNLTEVGDRDARSIYNSAGNKATDTLIVKNSNIKSATLALWFSKYEFSNITLKPCYKDRITRLIGEAETSVKVSDILGVDQEIIYDKKPTYDKFVVEDTDTLVIDVSTINNNEEDDHSIVVRYKKGFEVSNVEFEETYGYSAIAKEISIKNIGVSNSKIKNVISSDANFIIEEGNHDDITPEGTNNSWKIKPRAGLDAGVYTADIKVIDKDGNTYTSTVKITVNKKELTGLGISLNSTYEYDSVIEPVITGTTELGINDYKFVYSKKTGEELLDKPYKIGEYKVTLKVVSKNYYSNSEATAEFSIVKKNINTTMVIEGISDYTYNGIAIEQKDLVIKDGDTKLSKNFDYTLEYSDNINAGEVTITIKPVSSSNYTFDSVEKKFTIEQAEMLEKFVSLEKNSYRYTGFEIKPAVTLKDTNRNAYLSEILDYEVSYADNKEIGNNAKVIIKGTGNYKGTITKTFSIVDKEPQVINFANSDVTKNYGDSSFTITANHTTGNGTVKYTSSNTDVATVNETTGLVTIKKAGTTEIKATASATADYAQAEATYTLTVQKKDITYTATVNNKKYNNNKTATVSSVEFTGLVGSETLTKDTDYTVTAEFASANVGSNIDVNVKVILKDTDKANNYNLTNANYVAKANITGKEILEDWVEVDTTTTYTYNGINIEPVVKVKDPSGETVLTLTKGTHYTVEYTNNLNAGTGKIKITGIGNYSGEIEKEFTINKKMVTPTIEDIPAVTYNGSEHTPDLVVKDGSTTLVKGTDYTAEYTSNLRAGNGHVQISEVASGNYTFATIGKDFTINKYKIKASDVTLEYTSIVFDNNAKKPSVTVKMGSEVIPPIEYNVDYSNNTNIGTATVKVTIKADSDDFTGEVIKNFEIVNKTLLTISGINNQQVVYTGSPVVLAGNLTVSNGINPSDLTVKWYKEGTVISKPTNVGVYKVVYSYEDSDYIGSLTVDFEITKKESSAPTLNPYKAVVGDKLSSITLPTGFKWVDENETIVAGNKEYSATYTTNNDTTNYTTKNLNIKVYGKSKVNLTTSVNNGKGGSISASKTDILEGTTQTITFTPAEGFEINKVEVNGVDKTNSVRSNKLDVVMGNSDTTVVVTYKAIQYTITVKDVENVFVDPKGIIKVDYNSDKTFTIIAEHGYNLVSVKVNGVEKISEIVYNELTLKNVKADAEIVIVVERNTYKVIEGANQKYIIGESNEAKFKIDADYNLFDGKVYVDDVLVDSSNYTSESGSTIISLKKEFVDKISIGEHFLKVLFTNGEATTTFTVEKAVEQEKDIEPEKDIELKKDIEPEKDNRFNPKTGDNIILYVAIASISIFGILATVVLKRKKK